MNAAEAKLRAARALVARKFGWTQYTMARDGLGTPTGVLNAYACSWCMSGAMAAASEEFPRERKSVRFLLQAIKERDVARWNDAPGRTQAEVVAAFDRAIVLAEQEAAS